MSRQSRPVLAAGIGAAVGGAGGLVGLGGAEFRLPALVGTLGFTARQAVPVNLFCSFVVLAAALPFRAQTVPFEALGPYWPAILGMLAGSTSAAWAGAGWLKRIGDDRLNLAILVLLVLLGLTMIGEALFVVTPARLVPDHIAPTVLAAAAAGIVIGLVSSLLGVAGGELIIPASILLFGVDVKLAGSMSMLIGMPTIAVGLTRHFGAGAILRDHGVRRGMVLPMAAASIFGAILGGLALGLVPSRALKLGLGAILIWSAFAVFRHRRRIAERSV